MRRVILGVLLLGMLGFFAPSAFAARSPAPRKTIKDLSGTIPLGILQRSVGPKFYRSLLVSPIDDWNVVRARVTGTRLSRARVVRPAVNPAYNTLALKFANEATLPAKAGGTAGETGSALIHLLIYQIADGVMALSFAYGEIPPGREMKTFGAARLLVKAVEGRWTEIKPPETRTNERWSIHESGARNLRKIDREPIHFSSSAPR